MDIALLLKKIIVVNCKSNIIIDRTLCNYMTYLCILTCSILVFNYQSFIQYTDISSIDELGYIFIYYRRSKTSFGCVNVKCKNHKCIGVKSFVEALKTRYVIEKLLQGLKKLHQNFLVIRHSVKELLAKNCVMRSLKCIVGFNYYVQ